MPKRIAIVNDDATFLTLMRELLDEEGYEAFPINSETGAFERVRAIAPDLIITDIRLEHPDSGWNVLESVRLDPQLAQVPVIVCSADSREIEQRAEDLRRHRAEVLPKPFDLDELLTLVTRLIGQTGS
jgi:CheY-like chemotaxis protein